MQCPPAGQDTPAKRSKKVESQIDRLNTSDTFGPEMLLMRDLPGFWFWALFRKKSKKQIRDSTVTLMSGKSSVPLQQVVTLLTGQFLQAAPQYQYLISHLEIEVPQGVEFASLLSWDLRVRECARFFRLRCFRDPCRCFIPPYPFLFPGTVAIVSCICALVARRVRSRSGRDVLGPPCQKFVWWPVGFHDHRSVSVWQWSG